MVPGRAASTALADSASAAPTATATVTLARPIPYLPDVLQTSLGPAAGLGALRVSAAFPVAATVRVHDQTGAGAHGLAFMGMPARMAMTSVPMSGTFTRGESAMSVLGLLPEPGNRVNVDVVATSASGASGVVEVVDADGSTPGGSAPRACRSQGVREGRRPLPDPPPCGGQTPPPSTL